jgi:hypothetical protein
MINVVFISWLKWDFLTEHIPEITLDDTLQMHTHETNSLKSLHNLA